MSRAEVVLDARAASIFRSLAGRFAQEYIDRKLLPSISKTIGVRADAISELIRELMTGLGSLRVLFGHYAFAHRSHDGGRYSAISLSALDATVGESDFGDFLESRDSEALWTSFEEACSDSGMDTHEATHRPLLEGICELNFDIFEETGQASILGWIREESLSARRVEHIFERLVDIRNLGPKASSHILRDSAVLFSFEDEIHYADGLYFQPISSTLRKLARHLIPEGREGRVPDWILAGKVSKYARIVGVSGARANMGVAQFSSEAPEGARAFDEAVDSRLVKSA